MSENKITDTVEVVRCKNCWRSEEMQGFLGTRLYCHYWERDTEENGYCHEGV